MCAHPRFNIRLIPVSCKTSPYLMNHATHTLHVLDQSCVVHSVPLVSLNLALCTCKPASIQSNEKVAQQPSVQ